MWVVSCVDQVSAAGVCCQLHSTLVCIVLHHLQDNTESEWEPEYVGAGLGLKQEDPMNWQYNLRHSNHPLAPFPGEALKWNSYVYDDGTT